LIEASAHLEKMHFEQFQFELSLEMLPFLCSFQHFLHFLLLVGFIRSFSIFVEVSTSFILSLPIYFALELAQRE
jgi:hypothetical protein